MTVKQKNRPGCGNTRSERKEKLYNERITHFSEKVNLEA